MKRTSHCLLVVGIILALGLTLPASGGLVQFTATIDAAQETTASTSPATGTAVLLYDAAANVFDLSVTVNDFANTVSASHIHEGAVGVAGPPSVGLGDETVYTRNGNTLTATFANLTYAGDPAVLLSGGAYINLHSAAFPDGEVRGQLIPGEVKLYATMTPGQEVSTTPIVSDAFGAAQFTYDPATNMIWGLVCVYNFANTLTNSHIHEAPVGVSGGVTLGFGGAVVYTQVGNSYVHEVAPSDYPGSAANLLGSGAYVNVHSDVYAPGEIRGQLYVSDATDPGRLGNVSARGNVGTGDDVLITGVIISGTEPLRVLVTGRGPVLTQFNVANALANPMLEVYTAQGILVFSNDEFGTAPFQDLIGASGFAPTEAAEAAALLILPPGAYTSIVSGVGGTTGVALAEGFEVAW